MPSSGIRRVEYGIYTPDEVLRLSEAEISSVVINRGNLAFRNGVNDSRLGPSREGMMCPTCGNSSEKCPGHIGHIELKYPVINVEFLMYVFKLLKSVCFYCSNVLLPEEHPKWAEVALLPDTKKKLNAVYDTCQKKMICAGTTTPVRCGVSERNCGSPQPEYVKDGILVRPVFDVDELMRCGLPIPVVTPERLVQVLRYIPACQLIALGFSPDNAPPYAMFWKYLVVPPPCVRPSHLVTHADAKIFGENDLTIRLRNIIRFNISKSFSQTEVNLALYTYKGVRYSDVREVHAVVGIQMTGCTIQNNASWLAWYVELQSLVGGYQHKKYQTGNYENPHEQGRDRGSLHARIAGKSAKESRLRSSVFGKRCDYTGRTVVTPCTSMRVEEIGIPIDMCKVLTYPERVTPYNVHRLTRLVRAGPFRFPGANYVIDTTDPNDEKVISLEVMPSNLVVAIGWIVVRHLDRGDPVIVNRQPSLHKFSIMCHKLRPCPGKSIQLHQAATVPYNADFDGDEVNIHVPRSEDSRAEALALLGVYQNIVKDGRVIIGFQQHSVAAAYLLSDPEEVVDAAYANGQWLLHGVDPDSPRCRALVTPAGTVRGVDLLGPFLPETFCLRLPRLQITTGKIDTTERFTKHILNQGILFALWKDFGGECAGQFLDRVYQVLEQYIQTRGLTVGVKDITTNSARVPKIIEARRIVSIAREYVGQNREGLRDRSVPVRQQVEDNVCTVLDKSRDFLGEAVIANLEKQCSRRSRNGMLEMVQSGAKGSLINVIQTMALVGQQRDHTSSRIPSHTTHYNFVTRALDASSRGMIAGSFFGGLDNTEYFYHLIGARVGLVDTAVKTSETGYYHRRVCAGLEDCYVRFGGTVVNGTDNIVQVSYGDDGLDPTRLEKNVLRCALLKYEEVRAKYMVDASCIPMDADAQQRWKQQCRTYDPEGEVQMLWRALCATRQHHVGCMYPVIDRVCAPFHLQRILLRASQSEPLTARNDITPAEVQAVMAGFWPRLLKSFPFLPPLLELLLRDWFSTATVCLEFGLSRHQLAKALLEVKDRCERCQIETNEPVGVLGAQHTAAPQTQSTLNRFHNSGEKTGAVDGVVRIKEIINLTKLSRVTMCLFPTPDVSLEALGVSVSNLHLHELMSHYTFEPTPPDADRLAEVNKLLSSVPTVPSALRSGAHFLTCYLDRKKCATARLGPADLVAKLLTCAWRDIPDFSTSWFYSRLDSPVWWISLAVRPGQALWQLQEEIVTGESEVPQSSNLLVGYTMYQYLACTFRLRGLADIQDFFVVRAKPRDYIFANGSDVKRTQRYQNIDHRFTTSSSVLEMYACYGIDAAQRFIVRELAKVLNIGLETPEIRHCKLIASVMCASGLPLPMTWRGFNTGDGSVMKRASFEKTVDAFVTAAAGRHNDSMKTPPECIAWNTSLPVGTGPVTVRDIPYSVPPDLLLHSRRQLSKRFVPLPTTSVSDLDKLYGQASPSHGAPKVDARPVSKVRRKKVFRNKTNKVHTILRVRAKVSRVEKLPVKACPLIRAIKKPLPQTTVQSPPEPCPLVPHVSTPSVSLSLTHAHVRSSPGKRCDPKRKRARSASSDTQEGPSTNLRQKPKHMHQFSSQGRYRKRPSPPSSIPQTFGSVSEPYRRWRHQVVYQHPKFTIGPEPISFDRCRLVIGSGKFTPFGM